MKNRTQVWEPLSVRRVLAEMYIICKPIAVIVTAPIWVPVMLLVQFVALSFEIAGFLVKICISALSLAWRQVLTVCFVSMGVLIAVYAPMFAIVALLAAICWLLAIFITSGAR